MIELKQAYVIVEKDPVKFGNPGHKVLFSNEKNEKSKVGTVVRFRSQDIFDEVPEGLLILEESIYGRDIPDDHNQGTSPVNQEGA